MADSTLNKFIAAGTAADRVAFTPSPPTPASGAAQGYFWHETDTGDTYSWKAGTGWIKVNSSAAVTSLSTAISTVDSNQSSSISVNLSKITSLSTAVSTVDSNESTSLSQVSSSLSGAISSTTSLSTAVSTVVSGSISTVTSSVNSLSTAIGSGTTANTYVFPHGDFTSNDTGAFATLSNCFILAENITVDKLVGSWNNQTIGDIYSMFIAVVNSSGTISSTVATASSRFTTLATGHQSHTFSLSSPVALTAGTIYIVALVITSGSGTSPCRADAQNTVSLGYCGAAMPISIGAMIANFTTTVKRFWYAQNSDAPSSGAASGNGTLVQYALGMRIQI